MTPVAGLSGLEILLVNTRVGRNTRQLVAGVRARHQAFPKVKGVLDEPHSAKLAQRSSHTGPPGYIIGWTLCSGTDTVPAYVVRRACTTTSLSGS
jgi:hypothetical protein